MPAQPPNDARYAASATKESIEVAAEAPPSLAARVGHWWHAAWLPPVFLVLLTFVSVGLHMETYPTLSPIDEFQHVDYLFAIDEGRVPRSNTKVSQRTMQEEACRGIDAGVPLPPCDSEKFDPNAFQELGWNTAAGHPPTYYALAWAFGTGLDTVVPGVNGLVSGARLAGAIWLAIALLLSYWVMRRFGASAMAAVSMLSLVATTPLVAHASATVNPDSMVLLSGSAFAAALVLWDERRTRRSFALLLVATLFVVLVKSMNILVVGAGMLYIVGRAWQRRAALASDARPALLGAIARPLGLALGLAALGMVGVKGWLQIAAARARPEPPLDATAPMQRAFGDKTDIAIPQLLEPTFQLFNPISGVYAGPMYEGIVVNATIMALTFLIYGGVVGGSMMFQSGSRELAWARSTFITAAIAGLVVTLANYILIKVYLGPLPTRYGLIYLPMIAVCGAVALDSSRSTRRTGAIAATCAAGSLLIDLALDL